MERRTLLPFLACLPFARGSPGGTPTPIPIEPGANAVDLYRAAMAALPARTEVERAFLSRPATAPLDAAARSIVDRSGVALEHLTRAAQASACDWGDSWTGPTFDREIASIVSARDIAKIAALRARIAASEGRYDAAIDDIMAVLALSRGYSRSGVMIAQLIGFAIEHAAIAVAAGFLPDLGRDRLARLESRYAALADYPSSADTVRAERAFFLGYQRATEPEPLDDSAIAAILARFDFRIAIESGTPPGPAPQPHPLADEADAATRPAFEAFLGARRFVSVRQAQFRAAIAVASDGPGAIGRVVDPTDGRPFDLRSWATGFELTSRFVPERQLSPSLVVGRR